MGSCLLPASSTPPPSACQVEDPSTAPLSIPPSKSSVVNRMAFKVDDVVYIHAVAVDIDIAPVKIDE